MQAPDANAPWMGLEPAAVAGLFDALGVRWWVAGGWAIDLALARRTREHADLDIAVAWEDQRALVALPLAGWELFVPQDGAFEEWHGGDLEPPRFQFWVREPRGGDGAARWAFEVLLEDVDESTWRFRRDPSITLPRERFARRTDHGLPYVTLEVALLYKAKSPHLERNAADFAAARPALDAEQRAWLRDAIARVHPGHAWVEAL